ncbi:hypothetical protein KAR02_09275 [Candidatus Bipolaricaulota bacterium]|nr:hypothetical protein [Candidatus Bipolaricaulota bacterium]
MRHTGTRSFVIAQAFVGVVLTIFWLLGEWPSLSMATPLFGIAAVSFLLAFLPNARIPSTAKIEEPQEAEVAEHSLPTTRNLNRKRFAGANRLSRQFMTIAAFLVITALLIRFVAPMPGV